MVLATLLLGAAHYGGRFLRAPVPFRDLDLGHLVRNQRAYRGSLFLIVLILGPVDFDNFAFSIMLKQVVPLLMIWRSFNFSNGETVRCRRKSNDYILRLLSGKFGSLPGHHRSTASVGMSRVRRGAFDYKDLQGVTWISSLPCHRHGQRSTDVKCSPPGQSQRSPPAPAFPFSAVPDLPSMAQ